MVAGMVIMFWLDPSEVGKWNTVSIFLAYAPFLQLGIQSGLSIELPVTLGRNEESKARQFIANGLGFAILVSVVILLIGMLMTLYFYNRLGLDIAMGVVAITVVAICSSFTLHFIARFGTCIRLADSCNCNRNTFQYICHLVYLSIPLLWHHYLQYYHRLGSSRVNVSLYAI